MTPHDEQRYLYGRGRTFVVLTGITLAGFVTSVNHLMAIVAIPEIVGDLGGLDRFSWILTAHFLAVAVAIPIWGRASDMLGRREMMALSMLVFAGGSVLCGLAPSMNMLILGRVIQGIGAGGIGPIGSAAMADLMAPRERGKWMSYMFSVQIGASLAGPALGGWITDAASWRLGFLISAGLGVGSAVIGWLGLRMPTTRSKESLDYWGALFLATALVTGLLAMTLGGNRYGWGSPVVVALFAGCATLLAVFVWWERRVPNPVMPLSLYRNRTFAASQVVAFAFGCAHFTSQTYIPILVQGARGETATSAGAILIPFMVAFFGISAVVGQLIGRTGRYRSMIIGGPALACLGFVLLGQMGVRPSSSEIIWYSVLVGAGMAAGGAFQIAAQNALPQRVVGAVSSASQFARMIGGTVFLAILAALMTARLDSELASRLPGETVARLSVDKLIAGKERLAPAVADEVHEAFGAALSTVFLATVPVLALAVVAAFFVERRELRRTLAEQPEPVATT